MNKIKIIEETHQRKPIVEDSIFKNSKKKYSNCEFNPNLAKKRKISENVKLDDVPNNIVLNNPNSDSKATQTLSSSIPECLEDELKCSICKEMFIHPVTVNCAHSFCEYCISKWKNEHDTCPICRQEITNQNVSIVLEKCVNRVIEFSSKKVKNRRKKVVFEREKLNTLMISAPDCDELWDSLEEINNWDFFQILGYTFDSSVEENIEPRYDDIDQCIIS